MAAAFALLLLVFAVANLLKPDTSFSESENRILTQMPVPNLTTLTDGSFMTQMESYVSDQFFLRDNWISLKLLQDKLLGKKESNGVYLGKDGYLMEVPDQPIEENLQRNQQAITEFATRYGDLRINMALAPNSFYILKDKLPYNAPIRDQRKDATRIEDSIGGVQFLDLITPLQEHANEYIYYKTDHHWTTLGAYYGYLAMADGMGISNPITDYTTYNITNQFAGTLSSKSGYHKSRDSIQIYTPSNEEMEYIVTYADTQKQSSSVYNSTSLNEKDKYTVFFGGNHTLIDIETPSTETRKLLIFKDSYANCLIPFLIPYYREILVVDPRYYYDSIDQLIQRKSITDVLFLYNLNTFVTDGSLADTLAPDAADSETTDAADTAAPEEAPAE